MGEPVFKAAIYQVGRAADSYLCALGLRSGGRKLTVEKGGASGTISIR